MKPTPSGPSIVTRPLYALALAAAALGLANTPPAAAADPQMAGATLVSRDPVELSKVLGKVYKKESEGFQMTMPADARIIQRSQVDLVSFVVDAKSWGGSLQLLPLKTPMSMQEFLESTKQEIKTGRSFKGVQVLEEKLQKKDDKPGARLTMSMEAELGGAQVPGVTDSSKKTGAAQQVSLLRQQLIVMTRKNDQNKSDQFLVLSFYTPLKDKDAAMRTFNAMVDEFALFDSAALREKRLNAYKAGKDWLAQRSAEEYASKLIGQRQVFRILLSGQDAGYIQFDESTKEIDPKGSQIDVVRDGRKGVMLTVNVRSFGPQGIVVGKNDAFWSYSHGGSGELLGHYSLWSNLSEIRPSDPAKRSQATLVKKDVGFPWLQETGTLTQDAPTAAKPDRRFTMNVTYGGDSRQQPDNLHQLIPPEEGAPVVPLPKILEYTWPRFVDVTRPCEMSFATYNAKSQDRKSRMTTITLIATGKKEPVTINGKSVVCYKCVEEIDPDSTTLWVDAEGRIQMLVTSDQTVTVPTTTEAMVAKWGNLLAGQQ